MIDRLRKAGIARDLTYFPVVAILGARQVGKTTLARELLSEWSGPTHHFDLESVRDLARLEDLPLALDHLEGLVVLDEVQRKPELFAYLRVLADRAPLPARFLLLGSASPRLVRGVSESLAGRVSMVRLDPLSLAEVGSERQQERWVRGGFPRSLLAPDDAMSLRWRDSFVDTFLQQDLPELDVRTPPATVLRLWTMLAHQHGQVLNVAALARALDIDQATIRRYVDVLVGTFMVTVLRPWHENVKKRQVKRPKVYLADSGILHALLRVTDFASLQSHPGVGASWEGFALHEVVRRLDLRDGDAWFWATHAGAELDLLVTRGGRQGFEFKRSSTPRVSKSMRAALEDLALEQLDVVHPGADTYPLGDRVRALALRDVPSVLTP